MAFREVRQMLGWKRRNGDLSFRARDQRRRDKTGCVLLSRTGYVSTSSDPSWRRPGIKTLKFGDPTELVIGTEGATLPRRPWTHQLSNRKCNIEKRSRRHLIFPIDSAPRFPPLNYVPGWMSLLSIRNETLPYLQHSQPLSPSLVLFSVSILSIHYTSTSA
jgi:hypothetical protein